MRIQEKLELVSIETAELAKEKGFDWKCDRYYYDVGYAPVYYNPYDSEIKPYYANHNSEPLSISAPTQSLLQKWLRDVHNIHIYLNPNLRANDIIMWDVSLYNVAKYKRHRKIGNSPEYITYETALEAGLLEALKLIENPSRLPDNLRWVKSCASKIGWINSTAFSSQIIKSSTKTSRRNGISS